MDKHENQYGIHLDILKILNSPDNIKKMKSASDANIPALYVCVKEIEALNNKDGIDLNITMRQNIGKYIRDLMVKEGYKINEYHNELNRANIFTEATDYIKE